MKEFIQTQITKIVTSKVGPYIATGIGIGLTKLGVLIAEKTPVLVDMYNSLLIQFPELESTLSGDVLEYTVMLILVAVLNMLPIDILEKYGKSLQKSLNEAADILGIESPRLKLDGKPLAKTAAFTEEVKNAVEVTKTVSTKEAK